jgi:ligand-binding SRPBCC domain-containing protein
LASRKANVSQWEHERTIDSVPGGCQLTDRLRFSPRIRLLASLYTLVFKAVFRLRHRNLKRAFGRP